ncbi:hypothetical protein [Frigoribacterium sp. 2355]
MEKLERLLSGRHIALLILAVGAASGIVGAYLALALATADLANWGIWARDFAKSPGLAALAAVAAASIAFRGISKQVSVSRAALEHQREAARTAVWWQTFEWASSRALPSSEKDIPLPVAVTISTLHSLSQTTTTDVQKVACAGVIGALTSRVVAMPGDSAPSLEEPESDASAALDALASYVEASDGTPAASLKAQAVVEQAMEYEQQVMTTLAMLSPEVKAFREPQVRGARADAVVEIGDARVAVAISFARTVQVVRARSLSAATQRREGTSIPLVLVSRFPSPFTPEDEAQLRVVVAQWNSAADNRGLLEALKRASTL